MDAMWHLFVLMVVALFSLIHFGRQPQVVSVMQELVVIAVVAITGAALAYWLWNGGEW